METRFSQTVTRFAPSPTGWLHLGHAFSALFAEQQARRTKGRFLLRIEDIDTIRCRPDYVEGLLEDLAWLGVRWEQPVLRQSNRFSAYQMALDQLAAQELLYPCFCTRRDIQREIAQAVSAPHGPDGVLYPGICKNLSATERRDKQRTGQPFALRLHMDRAAEQIGHLTFHDRERGTTPVAPEICGDVVLARKDTPGSYHLAVVVDDAFQGVTLVTRGEDLFPATHIHRTLQALLRLPEPDYHHHPLLTDATGHRFAKRDKALTLAELRRAGKTPEQVRQMVEMGHAV